MSQFTIACFYKFTELTGLEVFKIALEKYCKEQEILGTIILAPEGINGTIAGSVENVQSLIAFLQSYPALAELDCKYSQSDFMPFHKSKILIKKEIVTFEQPNLNPAEKTGIPVAPEAWNDLISDPEVVLIDTRNTYETVLGTFKNAIDPKTEKFTEFANFTKEQLDPKSHKKIAMFCTGGIRCEKASAFLLEQGFETVYQLEGGILKYLEKIDPKDSLWEGKCFIFDDRRILEKDSITTL